MVKRIWDESRAEKRITTRINEVQNVTIKEYVRDTDLSCLANGVAYRVDGVHLYIDILNIDEMLNVTVIEGERSHQRTLRFLNLHYRAVRNILIDVDAIEVDFHNQRLHAVFAKPYADEKARIMKAVATAQLIRDVLSKTGENGDDPLPAAKTRIGIDSGKALAVNNGQRSRREPLFLGNPANQAAKRASGTVEGIYMTNNARSVVDWDKVLDIDATAVTAKQVAEAQDKAALAVTVDQVVKKWKEELESSPIGSFIFYRHTPPFQALKIEELTPANSRRQESVSLYADIDNFTRYVADRIEDDEKAKSVVKTLHALRGELDCVLHEDFAGKKIRFIGDCVHGILVEGTALTTDDSETAKNAILCAAAMRSSFNLTLEELKKSSIDVGNLGLQIGLEHGVTTVTRLGIKGERVRCCISRSVLKSEDEQRRCAGRQTAIGPTLYDHAPVAFQTLFGEARRCNDLDYEAAMGALEPKEESKKNTASISPSHSKAALPVAASAGFTFNSTAAQPSRSLRGFS